MTDENFFAFFRPPAIALAECTCGHLQYTHRYLGGKFACAAVSCPCPDYTKIEKS